MLIKLINVLVKPFGRDLPKASNLCKGYRK